MNLVNRSVLVLKPTAKMLNWINSVGDDSDPVTREEAQDMTNAYLLPDFEDDEEQTNHIRFRAKKLFEHEPRGMVYRLRGMASQQKLQGIHGVVSGGGVTYDI